MNLTLVYCCCQRAQTEAVTFLGGQESSRSLYAIPGLDYVAHEDILPYVSAERSPVQHELFDKFLTHCPDQGETSQILYNDISFIQIVYTTYNIHC